MTRYRIKTRPTLQNSGERLLARPGRGSDFYELRSYAQGDEPRFIDWRAFARTGRLYTRIFQVEAPARFFFFVDGSPSMQILGKNSYAHRVLKTLVGFSKSEGRFWWGGGRIGAIETGKTFSAGAQKLLETPRPKGTTVLITDALDNLEWPRLLRQLKKVVFIQVLAAEEINPSWEEGLLEDVELGGRLEVGVPEIEGYRQALEAHIRKIKTVSRQLGSYALLRVGQPIVPALLKQGILEER